MVFLLQTSTNVRVARVRTMRRVSTGSTPTVAPVWLVTLAADVRRVGLFSRMLSVFIITFSTN